MLVYHFWNRLGGKMKKGFILLTVLLLVSIIIAGCGGKATTSTAPTTSTTVTSTVPTTSTTATSTKPTTSTTAPSATPTATATAAGPKRGGTLKLIYDTAPSGSIGYMPEVQGDTSVAQQLVIETLIHEDNKSQFTPWLAESYKLADDQSSITFQLRKGITFHDGSDFNADVVKWNLDNSIAAKLAPNWKSVDKIDDYTVRINLNKWQNTMMSGFSAWMTSKAAFDKNGLDWVRANPVGTGPFKFVSYQKDNVFKTVRNPNYWEKDANGNQLPYLDEVDMLFIGDSVTEETALQAGEADMGIIKHGSKVSSDLASAGFVIKSAAIDTSVLFGDTANPDSPWANKLVREAVEYALDRDAIAKMGYGYWKPAYQIEGSADAPYDPNFSLGRKYDVAKAKALLADAGYSGGFNTTIIACPSSLNNDVVVAIQGYLAKVGIKASIEYPNLGKMIQDYWFGKWHNGIIYEPMAGFANYMLIFSILFDPVTNWHPSWEKTPAYIDLYNAALAAPSFDVQLTRALTDWIVEEALMTPVNEGGRGWALKSYVKDSGVLETNLPPYLRLEKAWLDK